MTISLNNQAVVVTGGARRLGKAIALACARAGADVAITYHQSKEEAARTLDELRNLSTQGRFAALPFDATREGGAEELLLSTQEQLGKVTALVNNAAIFRRTPFLRCEAHDFDDHIAANLRSPFLLTRHFGAHFKENGGGAIVNIADIHGQKPLQNYLPYCIAKAGLITLTQGAAKALAPQVRVNCICPGTILPPDAAGVGSDNFSNAEDFQADENFLRARIPLGRIGSPDDIAASVVFLLGGPDFISGAILNVDGAESLR